ncbi:MAG: hypothetical protein RIR00_932, partial [Pseudomonadota bacterium]
FLSTRETAKLLGVSLGTVQNMVENGRLRAWKTSGGHRRVSRASVERYLAERQEQVVQDDRNSDRIKVLIAEDEPILQQLYLHTIANWEMPLDVTMVGSGYEGLIQVGLDRPDVLIADLMLPGLDGFEMIRTLRARPELTQMHIIVVSGMTPEDITRHGGLPPDITVYGKPVPFHELRGFFQALNIMRAQRQTR